MSSDQLLVFSSTLSTSQIIFLLECLLPNNTSNNPIAVKNFLQSLSDTQSQNLVSILSSTNTTLLNTLINIVQTQSTLPIITPNTGGGPFYINQGPLHGFDRFDGTTYYVDPIRSPSKFTFTTNFDNTRILVDIIVPGNGNAIVHGNDIKYNFLINQSEKNQISVPASPQIVIDIKWPHTRFVYSEGQVTLTIEKL